MKKQHAPKRKALNPMNHLAFKYLKQVQKAVIECNALGLEVQDIEFYHVKPRIRVKESPATTRLEHIGRAIEYGFGNDENIGRYRELQINAAGIKVVWRTNRERTH